MSVGFTVSQLQRLKELGVSEEELERTFSSTHLRDESFRRMATLQGREGRSRLARLREDVRRPGIRVLEDSLSTAIRALGYTEVSTPIIISREFIERMNIFHGDKLWDQIFWIEYDRALRPMLAPNLYHMFVKLQRLWEKPIKIFEVGPCFRRESSGTHHLEEFTMLNMVVFGPEEEPMDCLRRMIKEVFDPLALEYETVEETAEVYGTTMDVVSGGMEIASGAVGPHVLDENWDVMDPWAGLGIGIERLLSLKEGYSSLKKAGRSLRYLDGVRLHL